MANVLAYNFKMHLKKNLDDLTPFYGRYEYVGTGT
jgi:hypothetical protein